MRRPLPCIPNTTHAPGTSHGPIIRGLCAGFSIFGELKSQPSRLSPTDHMDAVVGHKVASGLQVASMLLLGEILELTQK